LTFVWRHPKFYKRATNCRSDEMTPEAGSKDQATSVKHQATNHKLRQIVAVTICRRNPEASSIKPQASRLKLQAPSALKYFSISLNP